ncbi:hypothetical protein XU18_0955 [Perkinsela sp. CCAP 1560/4]|nr:hypothetical protein XU18_0955 [Perkinsela sp. CCAP 1560/4]|eukprot:KNH08552.1 hypothetical protein XU18_0955 [Perkinsela sp. CCAP 1560/4]
MLGGSQHQSPPRNLTSKAERIFADFLQNSMHAKRTTEEVDSIVQAGMTIVKGNSVASLAPNARFTDGKQRLFAETLQDLDTALRSIGESYFLAAGTALGAIRDGQFIPHDDDIDIGMFDDSADGSGRLLRVTIALEKWGFVPFQVLGSVDHGLELRCIHSRTKVNIDINWFYREAAKDGKPFLWCATYFGAAERRAHQKYRYRHDIFLPRAISFAGGSYLVPPVEYLREYYGEDWRVPKKFDYWEGLAGEYKNIIPE